jgi:polysaccharide deacetylase family protein (PEP-CTERM system associated)
LGLNTTASAEKPSILLTFDVEDWFQVENLRSKVSKESWEHRELRVFKNTVRIMDLLESLDPSPRATFFILGWVAKRLPALVRQIILRGHEVASHGYQHDLLNKMSPEALLEDLRSSKALLETITGQPVAGYRAPNFSIFKAGIDLVRRAGYRYDSSYNSFGGHGRYGHLDLAGLPQNQGVFTLSPGFFEVPISNVHVNNQVLPLGGGGYFRLFPPCLFRLGMERILKRQHSFVFYAHPWEFDPSQPRVSGIPAQLKFRHYVNLAKTGPRLTAMIRHFSHCRFTTISDFLKGA